MVIPGVSVGSVRGGNLSWGRGLLALLLGLSACRSERVPLPTLDGEANVVTQVQMVRPAAERVASNRDRTAAVADTVSPPAQGQPPERPEPDAIDEANAYCRRVEQQARETHAGLPKQLDRDTSATRVVAYGCDVVLEYAMHDLKAEEVAAEGVRALRSEVVKKLCADGGARGVMDHGGSFTNVYRDQQSSLIDQFTITAEDCVMPLSAEDAPVSFDL